MTNTHNDNNKNTLNKLSDLGLLSDLYFSLNYHHVMIKKSGLINKWKNNKTPLDLDLSCILYDKDGQKIDVIWYKKLRDESEAIRHYGDQLIGHQPTEYQANDANTPSIKESLESSSSDLETIQLNLSKLPHQTYHIALIVSSTPNARLNKVPFGEVEIQDIEGNTGIRVDLTRMPNDCHHLWFASLIRVNRSRIYEDNNPSNTKYYWRLINKQQPIQGHCMQDFVNACQLI